MPIRSRSLAVVAFVGLVLAFASCDKSPTSPRPPQQPGPSSPVTTVRLELVAPAEIAPGESVQLTANAVKSDGSVENVSGQAQWRPTTSEVLQLTSTGAATGRNRGEAFVTADFGGLSTGARILVLPKGTFRLSGTITESGIALENVTVTVISGVGEGLTAVTNFNGYVLYGVSGSVRIHAKKDGYLDAIQQLDVTTHRLLNFGMVADRPRDDFRGTYTLTITAASECSGTFPDAAKRRVYTANVAQNDAALTVSLTGSDFLVRNGYGDHFLGRVTPTGEMQFLISMNYYYAPGEYDIAERFSDSALLVKGVVTAKGTPELISGTLEGEIYISSSSSPSGTITARCATNGFEMVRR